MIYSGDNNDSVNRDNNNNIFSNYNKMMTAIVIAIIIIHLKIISLQNLYILSDFVILVNWTNKLMTHYLKISYQLLVIKYLLYFLLIIFNSFIQLI